MLVADAVAGGWRYVIRYVVLGRIDESPAVDFAIRDRYHQVRSRTITVITVEWILTANKGCNKASTKGYEIETVSRYKRITSEGSTDNCGLATNELIYILL